MKKLLSVIFYGHASIASIVILISFTLLGIKEVVEIGMTLERFKELAIGIPTIAFALWFVGYIMQYDTRHYRALGQVMVR